MNITHFVFAGKNSSKNLSSDIFPVLYLYLSRRNADYAAVKTSNQLIPICSDDEESLDPSLSRIETKFVPQKLIICWVSTLPWLVQGDSPLKRRKTQNPRSLSAKGLYLYCNMVKPILFLMLDMGVDRQVPTRQSLAQQQ
jgi:hypothetical protein